MTAAFPEDRELAAHLKVDELVAAFEEAEAGIRAGFASISKALHRLDNTFQLGDYSTSLRTRGQRDSFAFADPTEAIAELRRDAWRTLVDRMKIRQSMSIAAWKKLEKEMEHGDPPEITAANVRGIVEQFREDIPIMLKAAVDEVFNLLRPPGSDYKTNTEFEIGERVILDRYVEPYIITWHINHYRQQDLMALENVFRMLDGHPERGQTGFYSDLASAIGALPISGPCAGETEYFEFKGYRKGSLHLRFRRMDLVKKLNAVAGGKRLVPAGET